MRILHTADLHLREGNPDTMDALETLLTTADDHNVDLFTIGGDLFHTPDDADALRPRLRALFEDRGFATLAIPGNHDAEVYQENLDFGALDVLVTEPFAERHYDDVVIRGVPYTSRLTDDLFGALTQHDDTDKVELLLLHCTLDVGFRRADVGDEATTNYFPVKASTLAKLAYDYVLAGHIHANTRRIPLSNGGEFIYPGSPVSHSTKETGPRHGVLIDTDSGRVSTVRLDTFYIDRLTRTIQPGDEEAEIAAIEDWVTAHRNYDCDLYIEVEGFISQDETTFRDALESAAGVATVENRTRTVVEVLDHPLYQRFLEELRPEDTDTPDAVKTRVLQVLSKLLTNREIRP